MLAGKCLFNWFYRCVKRQTSIQYENDSEEQYLVKSKIWFQEQDVKTLLNKMLVFRIVYVMCFFKFSWNFFFSDEHVFSYPWLFRVQNFVYLISNGSKIFRLHTQLLMCKTFWLQNHNLQSPKQYNFKTWGNLIINKFHFCKIQSSINPFAPMHRFSTTTLLWYFRG